MRAITGAIHSVTRATARMPPKTTTAVRKKTSAATTSWAPVSPPKPGSGELSEPPKAATSVPATALDCTEVMMKPQVISVMTAKTPASVLFFMPRAM